MKLKNILIMLAIFQIVNHVAVFANGRDVAISIEAVESECICIDKDGTKYEINKLSVGTDIKGQTKSLPAKKGLSWRDLSIISLDYINFNETEINEEGYLNAKVKLIGGDLEDEYLIFVGEADDPVKLKGIDEYGNKISIELKDCKKVLFKALLDDYQGSPPDAGGIAEH